VIALVFWLGLATAGTLGDGAAAFDAGDLDGALEAWDDGSAPPAGKRLYDLGNVWYRKGDAPRAVAQYRAARRLRPRDGNVQHNLALARAELDGVPEPALAPYAWLELLTVGELGLVGGAVTAAGSLGLIVWYRRRKYYGLAGVVAPTVLWVLGLAMAGTATLGARQVLMHPIGVVVDRDVVFRDLPRADGEGLAAWKPGTEVRVVERGDTWVLAEDGRGRRGWVSDTAMLIVWP
jgi:hypothetical protein